MFSDRIKELRIAEKMTLSQFGKIFGMKDSGIRAIENGKNLTTLNKIISIANYFKVSLDWLMSRTDKKIIVTEERDYTFFSGNMRELRLINKMTQKQFGEILGISDSAVREIESGRSKTTLQKIIFLSDCFKISIDSLMVKKTCLNNKNKFNERFEILRKKHGYSIYKIAKLLNISSEGIFRLADGETKPSFDTLIKLADIFDVSIDYLVVRTDNPDVNKQNCGTNTT